MTFLELCQTLRYEIGLSGEGPTTVVGQTGQTRQFVGLVKAADNMIQNMYADWNFLWEEWEIPTVSGTEAYSPPAGFGIWDKESFFLDWGTEEAIPLNVLNYKEDLKWSTGRTAGTPHTLVILPDNSIKLNPIPDAVYTLTGAYYKAPVLLSANADVSLIPEQFHRIIIAKAKILYAEAEEAFNLMQSYSRDYQELLWKLEAHSLEGQQWHSMGQHDPMIVRPV